MIITNDKIEIEQPMLDLKKFASEQAGFSNRVACTNHASQIMGRAVETTIQHAMNDLSKHDECLIEEFLSSDGRGATVDVLLLNHKDKAAFVVDWKFTQRLNERSEWSYKMGPQPVIYALLVKELFPGYSVAFENRFVVDSDTKTHCVKRTLSEEDLEAWAHEINNRKQAIHGYNNSRHWPRVAGACIEGYGKNQRVCAFKDKCWNEKERESNPLNVIQLTQSLVTNFDRCPSFYYNVLHKAEAEGLDYHDVGQPNHYMLWGTMFHNAMAALYGQILANNPQPAAPPEEANGVQHKTENAS